MRYIQILRELNKLNLVVQQLSNGTIAVDRFYTITDFPYDSVVETIFRYKYCGAHQTAYYSEFGTFDIETTTNIKSIIDNTVN